MESIKTFFEENGYYLAKGVFTGDQLAGLEEDFDRIVGQLTASGEEVNARWRSEIMEELDAQESVIIHTHNVQTYSARWMQAFMSPAFLDVAEAILGSDIMLHHSKLFQKPPQAGAPFPIHQDWRYFPTLKHSMIAGIVHVSDATDEMGCVRVYPGSHRLGPLENTQGQEPADQRNPVLQEYPLDSATIIEAEPGDVVFFHYFTLHGSMPNRSSKTRKTVLAQLHAGDDEVTGNHSNVRLVLRGWNSAISRAVANAV